MGRSGGMYFAGCNATWAACDRTREREMTVKFYPARVIQKNHGVRTFLQKYKVSHELVTSDPLPATWTFGRDHPALEIDGRLFVNPNTDALRKILGLQG